MYQLLELSKCYLFILRWFSNRQTSAHSYYIIALILAAIIFNMSFCTNEKIVNFKQSHEISDFTSFFGGLRRLGVLGACLRMFCYLVQMNTCTVCTLLILPFPLKIISVFQKGHILTRQLKFAFVSKYKISRLNQYASTQKLQHEILLSEAIHKIKIIS